MVLICLKLLLIILVFYVIKVFTCFINTLLNHYFSDLQSLYVFINDLCFQCKVNKFISFSA